VKRSTVARSRRSAHWMNRLVKESSRRRRLLTGMSTGCLAMTNPTKRAQMVVPRRLERTNPCFLRGMMSNLMAGVPCSRLLRKVPGNVVCAW